MLTKTFLNRVNALPEPAKAQLADFLEFLEAKYGASVQPMTAEEFEDYIAEGALEAEDESQLLDGEEVLHELRQLVLSRKNREYVPA